MTSEGATTPQVTDERLATSRPPDSFQLVRNWVLDSVEQLSALRVGILRELAAAAGDPAAALDDVADDMVLIATELATNAIKYGFPPTEVQLRRTDQVYLLDIADRATDDAPQLAGPRAPGLGGLGMHIAQRLALDVGWYADDEVKHVWAILPAPAT